MGVGNLQRALTAYGVGDIPYAQLFFDSTPLRHAAAWRVLASLGDDSSTYLWRVGAAKDIMSLYREDPRKLAAQALLQASPAGRAGAAAGGVDAGLRRRRSARASDGAAVVDGAALRPSRALAAASTGPCAAPEALRSRATSPWRPRGSGTAPIIVTSATRSVHGEERDTRGALRRRGAHRRPTPPATRSTSRATTARRAQAPAFQFWLDRLTALDVIAWVPAELDLDRRSQREAASDRRA